MKTTEIKPATARLAEVSPEAIAHYKQMRALVMPAPGVDAPTCEIVLCMQLALRGHEVPFKVHAMRAIAMGIPRQQLEGLLLAGVGVSLIVCEAARALDWLSEAHEELNSPAPAAVNPA